MSLILEQMDPKLQEAFDPLIQKFWLIVYAKKAHKGLKKVYFDDGTIFSKSYLLEQLGLKLEDVVF